MLMATTQEIKGKRIIRHVGVVHGVGVAPKFEVVPAYNQANTQIVEDAEKLGADAIVGLAYDCGWTPGAQLMVHAVGTAVKLGEDLYN